MFGMETNLNTVAKIQLDGAVVLPLVGGVHAAGMTLQGLQTDLKQRYERLIKNAELTVNLAATSASVYVSGAVLRPGRIPLDRPLTAMEAIMEAGGFDPNRSKPSGVTVLRMENGQQKRYKLNLKSALKEGDTHPFQLLPFDIVHVPEKTFNF
jgi:polysaccharide export outer membrane protein